MNVAERIATFISLHRPEAFCDDCITKELSLSIRRQTQPITAALGTTDCYRRVTGTCSVCGDEKKVIGRA